MMRTAVDNWMRSKRTHPVHRLRVEPLEDRRLLDADPGWLIGMGAVEADFASNAVTDSGGNVYVSGLFRGTVDFDPGAATVSLSSLGGQDVFVAKYSPTGTLYWARRIGGADDQWPIARAIALDHSGHLYVHGGFQGPTDFDGDNIVDATTVNHPQGTSPQTDAFVMQLETATGVTSWTRTYGGDYDEQWQGIDVDADGSVWLSGYVWDSSGTVDLDPGPGYAPIVGGFRTLESGSVVPNTIFYVLKLNAAGQYVTSWGGPQSNGPDRRTAIAVDDSGVYVTGVFYGAQDFDFGPGQALHPSIQGPSDMSSFVAKYSREGVFQWVRTLRSPDNSSQALASIDTDATGVYVGGFHTSAWDLNEDGGFEVGSTTDGNSDMFVARYSKSDGALNWFGAFPAAGGQAVYGLESDQFGRLLVCGVFGGTVDFDSGAGISQLTASDSDAFLLKLAPATGAYQSVWQAGGAGLDAARDVAVDPAGLIYMVGGIRGTASFPNGGALISAGHLDAFVLKFNDGSLATSLVLDLNGAAAGTNLGGLWTNSSPVPLADPTQATLIKINENAFQLTQLTATLVSPNAGDLLAANTSGTSIVASFNGTVLTLSGTDTAAHYQQVLRTITYDNTLGGPPVGSVSVQIVASDGILSSTPATATLQIDPAPTVLSIARYSPAGPNTNDTQVSFLVTFSEPVEEVDEGDFALALTGSVSGTIVIAYLWDNTSYLVTVNEISGSGTLGLNLVPDGSILDSIGNTVLNGFVGQTYTIGSPSSTIAGRHIFYNQSVWDGNSAAISAASDNAARATDKSAYLPGAGLAVAANITSFTRGITGIMVDLSAGGNHAALTASDFVFKVGNNNAPSLWAAAPAPTVVSVIAGGGVGGSDRVEITWPSGAIRNQWLEVQVKANANTGLAATDVHFWGNKIADSGTTPGAGTFDTTSTDAAQVFATIGAGKPITDLRDYNRDGQVTSTDAAIVFANIGSIVRINVGAGGPFATDAKPLAADSSTNAVASALAAVVGESALKQPTPSKDVRRYRAPTLEPLYIDEYFRHIETRNLRRPRDHQVSISPTEDLLALNGELLDALVTRD